MYSINSNIFAKQLFKKYAAVSKTTLNSSKTIQPTATFLTKARFRRRISVASNAIQTKDNEVSQLIIYCLNCIRRDGNSTSKTGLRFYSNAC